MKPVISIIIPVYNIEKYIADCIDSVIKQQLPFEIECIIVDDCSTDTSYDVVNRIIRNYTGTKIDFHLLKNQNNSGVSFTRNVGLDVVKGVFIFFLDGDDLLAENAIVELYNGFDNHDVVIVSGMVKAFKGTEFYIHNPRWQVKNKCRLNYRDFIRTKIIGTSCNAVWNKLYRADFIKGLQFEVGRINEDSLFLYELSKRMRDNMSMELIIPLDTYYYRNRIDGYCNSEALKLRTDICDNLAYFWRDSLSFDKDLASELLLIYVSHLYHLLNDFFGRKKKFDELFRKYLFRWKELSLLTIITNLKGKMILNGFIMKYFPLFRLKWLNFRLNKIEN